MACITQTILQQAVPNDIDQDFFKRPIRINRKSSSCSNFHSFTMKLPVNVIAKKNSTRRTSIDSENANNTLNTVLNATEIMDNERLAMPASALHTASTPEMICGQEKTQTTEVNNNNIPDTCTYRVDDNGNVRGNDDDDSISRTIPCEGRSRSNSQYDDSGFNSSASDDKEDEIDTACYNCDNEDASNTHSEVLPRRVRSDSQLTLLEAKSLLKTTYSTDSLKHSDHKQLSLSRSESIATDSDASTRSITTTQRPTNRRRRARQDQNNNTVRSKQLHTYFKKSPVHLQDCFQEKGFLTFVACILYTLTLAAIVTVFGVVVSTAKAVVGTEDLNELKSHIQAKRRRRTVGASTPLASSS